MSTLRDGYMQGISNTDMVSAAKKQQADMINSAHRQGAEKAYTTIDQDLAAVYGQGGLAGLGRDKQIAAYNQQKNDLAQMIYNGTPEEAGMATKFAIENGFIQPQELDGIISARQSNEARIM